MGRSVKWGFRFPGYSQQASHVAEWQTGYGVVSFGAKDLPWVAAYIQNQREHHARGNAHGRLERITRYDDPAS